MRIVQVHPYKERTVRVLVQPRHGVRYDYAPTALRRMVTISSRRHYAEAGVVGVKPPVKAGTLRATGREPAHRQKLRCDIRARAGLRVHKAR